MDEDEASRGVQRRDKDRRGFVVEALARVTHGMKTWTRESLQERGGSNAYEKLLKITVILGYLKFCAVQKEHRSSSHKPQLIH